MAEHRDLVAYQRVRRLEDAEYEAKQTFISEHFPADVVRNLHKSGFFAKSKMTVDEIEQRVCQFFHLESIFDYAKIGEGAGVHLTLTKQAIKQERDNLTKLTDL